MSACPERAVRSRSDRIASRRVSITTTALFVFLTSCASSGAKPPAQPAAPANRSAAEQLRRDLGAIFSQPGIDHATWSVSVRSLKHDDTLFNLNASRMQTPASTMKLVTSAVAAEKLGWDYRYTTRIYATGPLTGGDLYFGASGKDRPTDRFGDESKGIRDYRRLW